VTLKPGKHSYSLEHRDFLKLSHCAQKYTSKFLIVEYRFVENVIIDKLGITVGSHFGNAVVRNKFKRWIREIFRQHLPFNGVEMNIILRPLAKKATFAEIEADILQFKGLKKCCQR
jgi:ribonuclease P protein component